MDFSFLPKYYMFFLNGAKFTIVLAIFTVIFGVILGVILALMRISNNKILNFIGAAYVEFIRGTPVLVQVYIIYYALPSLLGINLPDMAAGVLALSINSGAYVAEIIRAGIQAVDKGQLEAARSLGMKYGTAMRYIIVPQAIKNILPALGNEFITVIKESSIVSVIGIHELMYNADTVRGNTFRAFEPLIIAAIMYFVLTYTLSKLMGMAERRLKTSD
ncbi:amino acid ABC transporter permease [Candidatus Clostridium radicumherbarum]|uniref:Amino acid ABC transporter permease n=1 Tax=Candidatus Clostridium radicumherbarum TaxID=3381662 RepID=A0ABW8TVG9_9CLOT